MQIVKQYESMKFLKSVGKVTAIVPHGAKIWHPFNSLKQVCPVIVANLSMEEFETKAMSTSANPPRLWRRYVDETFVKQRAEHRT